MKAILGKKIGMSQTFSPEGKFIPVTLIEAKPNDILIRRSLEKDGYKAVQLALPKKEKNNKKTYGSKKEFRGEIADDVKEVTVDVFEPGDVVNVSGVSKGKGYQGVVKRHNFKGGPASHGHRHVLRSAGSIGGGYPQHVFKGMRMAGRMGADKVTIKNILVVSIDKEKNIVALKGAVPGPKGAVVQIQAIESIKEDK